MIGLLKHPLVKQLVNRFGSIGAPSLKLSNAELRGILAAWEVGSVNSKKILWGGANANWVIETAGGKYVLRNAGTNRSYLEFQIFIINQLFERDFPYATPGLLKAGEAYWVQALDHFWLLYRFLEGSPLKLASGLQPDEMGRLVANYHQAVHRIDLSHLEDFSLPLFETERVNLILQEWAEAVALKGPRCQLEDLLAGTIIPILEAYNRITVADRDAIEGLEKIPVYNDWHGNNILSKAGKIVGLVDFDSLTVAPRIVDIQNSLLYAAGSNEGIDLPRLLAFIQGYGSVLPLSELEVSLIPALLIDRVTSIIADLLAQRSRTNDRSRDEVLSFLIKALNWVITHTEAFIDCLYTATQMREGFGK